MKIRSGLVSLAHDAQEKFELPKFYYCNAFDTRLSGLKALCDNDGCQLRGFVLTPYIEPYIQYLKTETSYCSDPFERSNGCENARLV